MIVTRCAGALVMHAAQLPEPMMENGIKGSQVSRSKVEEHNDDHKGRPPARQQQQRKKKEQPRAAAAAGC